MSAARKSDHKGSQKKSRRTVALKGDGGKAKAKMREAFKVVARPRIITRLTQVKDRYSTSWQAFIGYDRAGKPKKVRLGSNKVFAEQVRREWWEARDGVLLRNDLPGGNKEVAKLRTKLRKEDSEYKESVNAINKAKRREVDYLEDKTTGLEELPATQYRAGLEKARLEAMKEDVAFRGLIAKREEMEKDLQKAYPQLNASNGDVVEGRRKAQAQLRENDLAFVKLKNAIGQAWRARSEYLLTAEPRLVELEKMVKERNKKR